jgi:polyferredoxin
MLAKVPEKYMVTVRGGLAVGWLILIGSLFYDPVSSILTDPNSRWSPLRIRITAFEPETCVRVQGVCLHPTAYPLGTSLFWGLVVPTGVFALLVFGHEFWRRICPLSFFAQLPRLLGKQRRLKRTHPKTGQVRYELAKIDPDSWLGRNYLYFQFGLLYLGVSLRVLFFDSNRLVFGVFLLLVLGSAMVVGYLYAGKTWCHYFCPMAPVQVFYGEPRGLLSSTAHEGDRVLITQSMCRRVGTEGNEESACVACNSPCLDIDAERSYWDGLKKSDRKLLYYGYAGLVVGYFLSYYFYAGNWNYLLSGAWTYSSDPWSLLFAPGVYLFGRAIAIPRIASVPLIIGLSTVLGYLVGLSAEKIFKTFQLRRNPKLNTEQLQHQIFTLCTFTIFNLFFVFAGRSYLNKLPPLALNLADVSFGLVSTLWLYRTWSRSSEHYTRESLATRLRKQLSKLQLDVSRFLEGRSLESLNADEVYVLAKIVPGFTVEKRQQAYKGILRDALEEGYVNSASSLEVLQQMREELGISEDEHLTILTELGVENPEMLDPTQQRTKENQLRLQSFRQQIRGMVSGKRRRGAKGLGRELLKVIKKEKSIDEVLGKDPSLVALRQEYGISLEEEDQIVAALDPDRQWLQRGDRLLVQLQDLRDRERAIQPTTDDTDPKHRVALDLLLHTIHKQQRVIAKGMLDILSHLDTGSNVTRLALSLSSLTPHVLPELLRDSQWQDKLPSRLLERMEHQLALIPQQSAEPITRNERLQQLEILLAEPDSLAKAVSLYLLSRWDRDRGAQQARQFLSSRLMVNALVKETVQEILREDESVSGSLLSFSPIEKVLCFSCVSLFQGLKTETLLNLAYQAQVQYFPSDRLLLKAGETSPHLLILVEGEVLSHSPSLGEPDIYKPICTLNELPVLADLPMIHTLTTGRSRALVLTLAIEILNELIDQDKAFARRLIARESRQLHEGLR